LLRVENMSNAITQVHDLLRSYRGVLTKKTNTPLENDSTRKSGGSDHVDISNEAKEKLQALKQECLKVSPRRPVSKPS